MRNNNNNTQTPSSSLNELNRNSKIVNNSSSHSSDDLFNKMSSSNRHNANKLLQRHRIKPAELFRTDFITAMKLPDNEILDDDTYWLIKDSWKLDWEKGVQVPVKPEFNTVNCKILKINDSPVKLLSPQKQQPSQQQQLLASLNQKILNKQIVYKLPKKYLCASNDPSFDPQVHEAYVTHRLVDDVCRYDSDEMDVLWLSRINCEFQLMGLEQLQMKNFERIIEQFEVQSYENIKQAQRTLETYSIEYDDEVVCDVCRSPDSEDTNEMVFCDGCNLCVHQACYGIEQIPKGSWLCAPCELNIKPQCVLCPNSGGAMKCSRNLRNWCHVSCALWIPEVSFGNPDRMEPIVNLNKIPAARWTLLCHLCKDKHGCCFQCSEKKCHLAFHITCAFKHNLEMQTTVTSSDDDIVFRAYCLKHSRRRQHLNKNNTAIQCADTNDTTTQNADTTLTPSQSINNTALTATTTSPTPSSISMDLCKLNEQERRKETEKRLQKLDQEFYKYVSLDETVNCLKFNYKHIDYVFQYWKLKRRLRLNKQLLIPKQDEDLMNQSERILNARIKMFIHLRQDLERVRNLCYMVIKREKFKKKLLNIKHTLFYKQVEFLCKYGAERSGRTKDILLSKHDNCIYDYVETSSGAGGVEEDLFSDAASTNTASMDDAAVAVVVKDGDSVDDKQQTHEINELDDKQMMKVATSRKYKNITNQLKTANSINTQHHSGGDSANSLKRRSNNEIEIIENGCVQSSVDTPDHHHHHRHGEDGGGSHKKLKLTQRDNHLPSPAVTTTTATPTTQHHRLRTRLSFENGTF